MSLLSRAIPGLFGGVSQAIPAMRHPTQGDLQENALSTVVDGLYKRPGSSHLAFGPQSWASTDPMKGNAFVHVIDRAENSKWALFLDGATAKVCDLNTGAVENVTFLSGASYLSAADPQNAFRCITVADTTFVVNTGVTVTAQGGDGVTNPVNLAYVYVAGSAPQHTYSITINGVTYTHTTGTSGVTTSSIAAALQTAIGAAHTVTLDPSVAGLIKILFSTGTALPITASDTFGNTSMRVLTNGVQKFSDLPPSLDTMIRLRIIGADAVSDKTDPYYVNFVGGKWVECRALGISIGLTNTTMPHTLVRSTPGNWVFAPVSWALRLTGDDNTNPHPSFVDRSIRDIFFYRNRLGVLAGDSLVMSRSGSYFDFYSATATDVLDTDPIDLSGSAESVDTLDWAVPLNRELVVWASTKQQFALAGGDVLTPENARLVPTTAFESVNNARPKSMGNRIVYAFEALSHTQLGNYKIAKDTVSNTSESLTDHVPTYIPVGVRAIETSESFKAAVLVPSGNSNELYFFKYEDDGEQFSQRAWQKFTFKNNGILKAHWSGSKLYIFCYYVDSKVVTGVSQNQIAIEVIDFNTAAVDTNTLINTRLDRKVVATSVVDGPSTIQSTVVIPFRLDDNTVVVLQNKDGNTRSFSVVSVTRSDTSTSIIVNGRWTGGTTLVGVRNLMRYRFTEVFLRDKDDVPVLSATIKLLKILVNMRSTGYFVAKVKTRGGKEYSYPFSGQGVGLPGQLLGTTLPLVDGTFSIPVQAKTTNTQITIESDSFYPCRIPFAEWNGAVTMKASR